MILGNALVLKHKSTVALTRKLIFLSLVSVIAASSALAASIDTDTTVYYFGQTINISGQNYGSTENVSVELADQFGMLLDSWTVPTGQLGSFLTKTVLPSDGGYGDTLTLTAEGETSGLIASTSVVAPGSSLNQLKNGTNSSSPEWANGNVNSSNSCYAEGNAVPYRYFVLDMDGGTQHYFTIQAEASKATIHAFDYFTDYDMSESGPITLAGGPCGNISTAPPADCSTPSETFAFPDPSVSGNYVSVPSDMLDIVSGSFSLDGPRDLKAYNVIIDSIGKYSFAGSASDRTIQTTVYFSVVDTGSVGFYWGGHLAEGTSDTWGIGEGSASVSGAPYHMRAIDFDGAGGKNQDRSVQGATICLPPTASIFCSVSDSLCGDSAYTCLADTGADYYEWDIVGGSLISGQGTTSITYTVDGSGAYTEVVLSLTACDSSSSCASIECCSVDTVVIPIGDCSIPCTASITCPPNVTIECDESSDTSNTGVATYSTSGDCGVITLGYSDQTAAGACASESVITRTWAVVQDGTDTLASCQQTITIQDTTAPTFDQACPADATVACDAVPTAPTMTATDNCGSATVVYSETTTPGACVGDYTLTRQWIATDVCGNADTCTQMITVQDNSAPIFDQACPADATVACDAVPTAPTLTATDNCGSATVAYSETTTLGACVGDYTLTRQWVASDDCGNADTCTQVITVQDNSAPAFDQPCPADATVSCDAVPTAPTLTATDNCGSATVTYSETNTPGGATGEYTLTRQWIAADDCGNADTCIQTITVQDNTPPALVGACPSDTTVECDGIPTAPMLSATDNCDPSPIVIFNETTTTGACANSYVLTREWIITDEAGNADTCTQTITVLDTTPPAFDQACPADATVQCDAMPTAPTLTATDACDPSAIVTFTEATTAGACADSYTLTRQWIASDACGNADTCTQTLTVQDTTPPAFDQACPTDIAVECDAVPTAPTLTATDNCDAAAAVTFSESSVAGACVGSYTLTRQWVATDACGNADTCTQVITVTDNTPPVFVQSCPADVTAACDAIPAPETLTATDNCGSASVTYSESSMAGVCTGSYTITRMWIASDQCGNADTCIQIVTVEDNTAPAFDQACPADATVACDAVPVAPTLTATDNCGSATVAYSETTTPGACAGNYLLTRQWVASDDCGNADTCTQVLTVEDNTPPVFDVACPADATVSCDAVPTAPTLTATDDCGTATVTFSETTTPGGATGEYTLTRQWIAADDCGNADTCTQTLTVMDNTAPTFNQPCPTDITVECDAVPTAPTLTATDNCNGAIVTMTETTVAGACDGNYSLTRMWIASDDAGNADTCVQVITVQDTSAPAFNEACPTDVTVECDAVPTAPNLTATDNCDAAPTVTFTETSSPGACADSYTITRQWIAADACGNADTCTQIISVQDTTPPAFDQACPADAAVECDAVPTAPTLTATDNCDPGATVTFTETSNEGACTYSYTITRQWVASDACGNADTCTQILTVQDTTDPTCLLPNDTTIYLCAAGTICLPVSASDNCDGDVTCNISSGPGAMVSGEWCYDASGTETVVVDFICTDDCGNFCLKTVTIHFEINTAPQITISAPASINLCAAGESVCVDITVVDPGNGVSGTAEFGTVDLGAGTVCFIADTAGTYCNTVIVSDTCGLADTASFCIVVGICDPITIDPGQTIDLGLLCDFATGCLTAPAVTYCGSEPSWTVNGVAYSPDTSICYTINEASGNLSYVYVVTDSCGRTATTTSTVSATFNQPPTVNWVPPTTVSLCAGDTVCFGIGGIDDPDGNFDYCTLLSGPPGGHLRPGCLYCVEGGYSGTATIIIELVDECGASVIDTFTYEQITEEPIDIVGASYDIFSCGTTSETFAIPQVVSGTLDSMYYNGSLFVGDSFTVMVTASGTTVHSFTAFGPCDLTDNANITINAVLNSAPVLTVDAPDTLLLCDNNGSLCVQYSVYDPDNGLTVTSQLGSVNQTLGTICFDIDSTGLYCDRVIATDSCGAADTVDYCIRVILNPACFCPTITLEKTHGSFQGHYETVTVSIDDLAYGMGGFDLLIAYDASALSFVGADPGQMLLDCGWEYFSYRFGENGNCGANACPAGVLRITAIAETNNGPNHPGCFGLFSGDLAYLRFLITNDRTYECQYVPIQFIWYDCGDNTVSSVEGDTLFISGDVYSFEGSVITDLGAPFPSYFGANSSCDIALGDGKPDPIRCVDFVNGGVDIVCADSIDGAGDVNLNEFPYEIADGVLFSNYFILGISVFQKNLEGQIAATDVNKDGLVLTVADLVYLIKVIVGDAAPYSKATPEALTYQYDGHVLTFNGEAAAVAMAIQGNTVPVLLNSGMDMKYAYDAGADVTRLLVYSMTANGLASGSFLEFEGEIVSIEAATGQGTVVKLTELPVEFSLDQNYPNPFNPITTISFVLPKASTYDLEIFNVRGQTVASFSGSHQAGRVSVEWDATDYASGLYFYRVKAGDHSAVRKMILLK